MTGQNKITGLRRLDQAQGHVHQQSYMSSGSGGRAAATNSYNATAIGASDVTGAMAESTFGVPRTGPKTEMESGTIMAYVFVGTYTA